MRIAAIDVGTNTVLLLVAEVDARGVIMPLYDEQRFVRLGQGVDSTGRINDAAMQRLRHVLLHYRAVAEGLGVERIVVGATSAARDASNRADVVEFVRRETGLVLEILSGEDEATLSFAGAVAVLPEIAGGCVVVDVGGGSTEIVVGTPSVQAGETWIDFRCSIDVGSVRISERFFGRRPPSPDEVAAARSFIEARLLGSPLPETRNLPVVAAAGTATTLGLVHSGVTRWAQAPQPVVLTRTQLSTWRDRLLGMATEDVLALSPEVLSGREDVFPAGILILEAVLRRLGAADCRISPGGLRHGLALRVAAAAPSTSRAGR
jgi:exopolyphosphatase / guanosine-5'-triphosphate,3'-diphosphate pyrophosphatase